MSVATLLVCYARVSLTWSRVTEFIPSNPRTNCIIVIICELVQHTLTAALLGLVWSALAGPDAVPS